MTRVTPTEPRVTIELSPNRPLHYYSTLDSSVSTPVPTRLP